MAAGCRPEMFCVTGSLCCIERFIPANAFMTFEERLRVFVTNMKYSVGGTHDLG